MSGLQDALKRLINLYYIEAALDILGDAKTLELLQREGIRVTIEKPEPVEWCACDWPSETINHRHQCVQTAGHSGRHLCRCSDIQ